VVGEREHLVLVVGQQPDRLDAEVVQHPRRGAEVADVDRQTEGGGRVDGVEPLLVLQHVGADLRHEADAAALVAAQVHQHAALLVGDGVDGGPQLRTALAAQRAEHVAGEALRVHPDQHVLLPAGFAAYEGEVLVPVVEVPERDGAERAPPRHEVGLGDLRQFTVVRVLHDLPLSSPREP
jgi:hypothetical protein